MDNKLGKGGFGLVKSIDGKAVKYFNRIRPLIAEYAALNLVKDCPFIVNPISMNLKDLSLSMELCETSLRRWLEEQHQQIFGRKITKEVRKKRMAEFESELKEILEDVLRGLIYLHDHNLLHSDVKPSNILLVRRNGRLGAVLGDCGFVSRKEYARTSQTTAAYRDKYRTQTYAHDIYSLGITFIEIYGRFLTRDTTEAELMSSISHYVPLHLQNLVRKMIGPPTKRPTARQILKEIYGYDYSRDTPYPWVICPPRNVKAYRRTAAKFAKEKGILRGAKALNAVSCYLATQLPSISPLPFIAASFYICRSTFGSMGSSKAYRNVQMEDYLTLGNCDHKQFRNAIVCLCESKDFLTTLFADTDEK